jgi:hypothetical protein
MASAVPEPTAPLFPPPGSVRPWALILYTCPARVGIAVPIKNIHRRLKRILHAISTRSPSSPLRTVATLPGLTPPQEVLLLPLLAGQYKQDRLRSREPPEPIRPFPVRPTGRRHPRSPHPVAGWGAALGPSVRAILLTAKLEVAVV